MLDDSATVGSMTAATDTGGTTAVADDAHGVNEDVSTETTESVVEAPVTETAPEDGAEVRAVDQEENRAPEEEEPEEAAQGDGRTVDDRTRKALASLRKVDAASEKVLREDYHRGRAIAEEVGAKTLSEAVSKVRQLQGLVDGIGGEEGLSELQTKAETYEREVDQFANGDPALHQELYNENAQAYARAIGIGLELLAKNSPELFLEVHLPATWGMMREGKLYEATQRLIDLAKEGDGQGVYDLAVEMQKWTKGIEQRVSKHLEAKKQQNPEREALERDKREFNERRTEQYKDDVARLTRRETSSSMGKIADSLFRDLKLPEGGRKSFLKELDERVGARLQADKAYQNAAANLLQKGDPERAARYIASKFAEYLPEVFRTLRNEMYPNYRPGKPGAPAVRQATTPPNGTKAAAPPVPKINYTAGTKPAHEQVDWNRTRDEDWILGKAVLKNGKQVTFDWSKVPG